MFLKKVAAFIGLYIVAICLSNVVSGFAMAAFGFASFGGNLMWYKLPFPVIGQNADAIPPSWRLDCESHGICDQYSVLGMTASAFLLLLFIYLVFFRNVKSKIWLPTLLLIYVFIPVFFAVYLNQ